MNAIRVRLVALGFGFRVMWVRMVRFFRSIGRPRLGSVDHVTIPVNDLNMARRFYCDVLGAGFLMRIDNEFFRKVGRPQMDPDAQSVFHLSLVFGGRTRVDLFQQTFGQAAPSHPHPHYAFRISPRDLSKWKARLEAEGVPMEGPFQLGPPGQASLYFNDPFGNHLELACMGYLEKIPVRTPDFSRIVWPEHSTGTRS
ncbi:MAG: VOC family protein [Leptospirales bacterium]